MDSKVHMDIFCISLSRLRYASFILPNLWILVAQKGTWAVPFGEQTCQGSADRHAMKCRKTEMQRCFSSGVCGSLVCFDATNYLLLWQTKYSTTVPLFCPELLELDERTCCNGLRWHCSCFCNSKIISTIPQNVTFCFVSLSSEALTLLNLSAVLGDIDHDEHGLRWGLEAGWDSDNSLETWGSGCNDFSCRVVGMVRFSGGSRKLDTMNIPEL